LCLAALAAPPAWAQEEDDDFPFWIPEMEADFQDPAPVVPRDPGSLPPLVPDPEPVIQRDPGYPPDPPPSLENLIQDPDLPALVLDPDPSPEILDPSEAAPEGEVDLSAPGMTGSSGGTIPIMLVEAAYLAHRKGDYQAAIDGYTRIIRRRGLTRRERAVTYLLRGEARRDAGQPDEAILDFTRALRQWPGYPSAHYFRGRVYERQSRLNDAYADLAMAVQLDPARESYQTSLSLLKLKLKEAGLLSDGPPPRPGEPHLPGE
jgi:tetratricopeptide (TPR) repeat protein